MTWSIAAALLVVIPQLRFAQFNTDDYSQLAVLEGIETHRGMSPLDLYGFLDGDPDLFAGRVAEGPSAWDGDPSQKINFFRPLSSALMALNHQVSGLEPLGYAIHGFLWYLAAIGLLGLLVVRVLPDPRGAAFHPAAYLALIAFALSSSHCPTVLWNAARWLLIATTLGLAGLVAHLRWREDGWNAGRPLSLVAFAAALLAGESSLALLAFVAAYELFENPEPLRGRIGALLPVSLMVVFYLAVYKLMGFGSSGVTAYRDPLDDPVAFFAELPSKLLAMTGELFLGVPSAAWFFPERRLGVVLWGGAAIVLVAVLLRPIWKKAPGRHRRRILWMIGGVAGSLLPLAARAPNPHVLMVPAIGSGVLVGLIVFHSWRDALRRPGTSTVLRLLGALVLVCTLLIRPPFSWFEFGRGLQSAHEQLEEFHSGSVVSEILPHQKAIFLNFNSWSLEFHGFYYRKVARLPMPAAWWHLSRSSHRERYRRTAPDTLVLELLDGSIDSPMKRGEVRELPGLRAEVEETNEEGITRARFQFDRPLEDDELAFVAWRDGVLETVEIPPVGGSILLD